MIKLSSFKDWDLILQARIKKIMQADEDVGKIALAVPVLVCESQYPFFFFTLQLQGLVFFFFFLIFTLFTAKALELFLQDLCDRTYEITLQRGAKTVSSLHL